MKIPLRRWHVFLPITCLGPVIFLLAGGEGGEHRPEWIASARIDLEEVSPRSGQDQRSGFLSRLRDPLETARIEWDASRFLAQEVPLSQALRDTTDCDALLASLQDVFPSDPQALRALLRRAVRFDVGAPTAEFVPVVVTARRRNADEALALTWTYAEAMQLSYERFLRSLSIPGKASDHARLFINDRAEVAAGTDRSPFRLVLLSSVALGLLAAFAAERRDQRLVDPRTTADQLGLPLLGVVPGTSGRNPAFANGEMHGSVSESLHDCAAALRQIARTQEVKSFAVTSSTAQEGKSSLVCNLGRLLARKGLRVLLVDCDLRTPTLHESFGLENSHGVAELVDALGVGRGDPWARVQAIEDDLARSWQATRTERLSVITAGGPVKGRRSPLAEGHLRPLVLRLARDADVVLYDTPALSTRLDALDVARATERTLLVVDAVKGQRSPTLRAKRLLIDGQATIAGIIFNRSHPRYGRVQLSIPPSPPASSPTTRSPERSLTNAGA